MKKVLLLLVTAIAFTFCGNANDNKSENKSKKESVIEIASAEQFAEVIKSDAPVVIDFYATWCGPCKTQGPIIHKFADSIGDAAKVLKIDVDKNGALAQKYSIKSIPTIIILKDGKEVFRNTGVMQADKLTETVAKFK